MVEMVDSFSEKVGITKDQLSYHHSREEIIVNVKEESAESFDDNINEQLSSSSTQCDNTEDGGYGWLVVFAAFTFSFSTIGRNLSWGVYQDIIQRQSQQEALDNVHYPQATLSLVGTLGILFTQFGSVLVTWKSHLTHIKTILLSATLLQCGGLVGAASATRLWELYLYYSVICSIGSGVNYGIGMRVVPLWFTRRRSTAMSIVESSAGFGGLVLPIIMTAVSNKLGVQWSFRIVAIVFGVLNLVGIAFMRLPPRVQSHMSSSLSEQKVKKRLLGLDLFRNTNYALYNVVALLQVFIQYLPPYILPSYATYLGLSSWQASSLVSVGSISLFIGQICCGMLADYIGPINTSVLYSTIAAISALAIWMVAYTYASLMIFAVIFCFFGSSYFSLYGPITISIVGMDRYPEGLSLLMLTNCPALFSPTIANLIESQSHLKPYLSFKILCGAVGVVTTILIVVLRLRISTHRQWKI